MGYKVRIGRTDGDSLVRNRLCLAQVSASGFGSLARATVLSGVCWTPPALANGLLYVRSAQGELRCLDLRP